MWATFPHDAQTFTQMGMLTIDYMFPEADAQFREDASAALTKAVAGKSVGDLRTCVNVAIAVK